MVISQGVVAGGFGRTWAVALAAFFVGLVSYTVAGRLRVPPLVVVVSAVQSIVSVVIEHAACAGVAARTESPMAETDAPVRSAIRRFMVFMRKSPV